MVPPTSIWTGAVYLDAAATNGIPGIFFWLEFKYPELLLLEGPIAGDREPVVCGVGVGDDEFESAGDVAGDGSILKCVADNNLLVADDKSLGSILFIS